LLTPQDGPVSITAEFKDPTRRDECIELMRDARMIFLRNGANRWHINAAFGNWRQMLEYTKAGISTKKDWKRIFSFEN
jgi:hypothetical protein